MEIGKLKGIDIIDSTDRVTLPIEETYEEKLQQQVDEVASHNYHFMQRYKPIMDTWQKTHRAAEKPPIYKDNEGKFYWANRNQRRAQNLR